jgi:hypothetical protein
MYSSTMCAPDWVSEKAPHVIGDALDHGAQPLMVDAVMAGASGRSICGSVLRGENDDSPPLSHRTERRFWTGQQILVAADGLYFRAPTVLYRVDFASRQQSYG